MLEPVHPVVHDASLTHQQQKFLGGFRATLDALHEFELGPEQDPSTTMFPCTALICTLLTYPPVSGHPVRYGQHGDLWSERSSYQ